MTGDVHFLRGLAQRTREHSDIIDLHGQAYKYEYTHSLPSLPLHDNITSPVNPASEWSMRRTIPRLSSEHCLRPQ
jgi:hypothetical protein